MQEQAQVTSVSKRSSHGVSKDRCEQIRLLAGFGVEGDAHAGETVKHRSRVARDPSQPNYRQVHLIHSELHDELTLAGYRIGPAAMGENITTRGLDLLGLPRGTRLRFVAAGDEAAAEIEITGLRNPCAQLDGLQSGLMRRLVHEAPDGKLVRKAGVMAIVLKGGVVTPGAAIEVALPEQPWLPLEPV